MARKTFNSLYNQLATENHKEQDQEAEDGELGLATEGFAGGIGGFVGSIIPNIGFVVNGTLRAQLKAKERELDALGKDLKRLTVDAGKQAVAAGKLDSSDFERVESGEVMDFLIGALLGSIPFVGAISGYAHGSGLQDTMKKIKKVKGEIDELLMRAAADQAKAGQ